MLYLILSTAFAACTTVFGVQNPGGDWSFSPKQEYGMVPVEACLETVDYRDLTLLNGKYVVDSKKLTARLSADKAKEDLEKAKSERFKALAEKVLSETASIEEKDEVLKLLIEKIK